ncbi:MAG: hypothetical protein PW792_10230 [Acidobacteriaceae bacterium]|nr:hypothetical protein [Acidobacteriaceae bacterium]
MSQQTEPTIESLQAELTKLRETNADLLRAKHERGEKIKALVAELDTSKASLTTAQATIHEMTVGLPLKELASESSATPGLWLSAFNAAFKAEMKDGRLVLLNQAGEPVQAKDGKEVTPEWSSLSKHLATSDDASLKELASITRISKASGGGAGSTGHSTSHQSAADAPQAPAKPAMSFGLRSTNR